MSLGSVEKPAEKDKIEKNVNQEKLDSNIEDTIMTTEEKSDEKNKFYLTLRCPENKDKVCVEVKVEGRLVYSQNLEKNEFKHLRLESVKAEINVEIYFDGVLERKETLKR